MTREDIQNQYAVDEYGIIRTPGQFEGEPLYVPYFWDAYLNGFADVDDGKVLKFRITPKDREQFPEIPSRVRWIRLYQCDSGFVNSI